MFFFFKYLNDSKRLKVPFIFVCIKLFGPSIDLSTCVSAAKLKITLGLYCLIILIIPFLLNFETLKNIAKPLRSSTSIKFFPLKSKFIIWYLLEP